MNLSGAYRVSTYWINHSQNKWLGWLIGIIFVLVLLLGTVSVLAEFAILPSPI